MNMHVTQEGCPRIGHGRTLRNRHRRGGAREPGGVSPRRRPRRSGENRHECVGQSGPGAAVGASAQSLPQLESCDQTGEEISNSAKNEVQHQKILRFMLTTGNLSILEAPRQLDLRKVTATSFRLHQGAGLP